MSHILLALFVSLSAMASMPRGNLLVTVENIPSAEGGPYCQGVIDFVRSYFGPALKKEGLSGEMTWLTFVNGCGANLVVEHAKDEAKLVALERFIAENKDLTFKGQKFQYRWIQEVDANFVLTASRIYGSDEVAVAVVPYEKTFLFWTEHMDYFRKTLKDALWNIDLDPRPFLKFVAEELSPDLAAKLNKSYLANSNSVRFVSEWTFQLEQGLVIKVPHTYLIRWRCTKNFPNCHLKK